MTWGHASAGADSSAVRDQLKHVQQIQATALAFAAILLDESVVTWGVAKFAHPHRRAQPLFNAASTHVIRAP